MRTGLIELMARESRNVSGMSPHQRAVLKALVQVEQCHGTATVMTGALTAWVSLVKTIAANAGGTEGGVDALDRALAQVQAICTDLAEARAAFAAGTAMPNTIMVRADVIGTPEGRA